MTEVELQRTDPDLQWLALLDQLYALIEAEPFDAPPTGWPAPWQPLVRSWATRIGARSIQIGDVSAPPSPGQASGFVYRRRITVPPPAACPEGHTLSAQSISPHGFTTEQVREFHALCRHFHVALSLRSSLDAERQRLSGLYEVIEALPMGIVVLDECAGPVLLNRRSGMPQHQQEIAAPPAVLAQQMQQRCGLTAKEMALAWNLAQGMALKQYAALSGRSIETLRVQLRSVFRKLGTSDQKGAGVILFDALHALTLHTLGEGLIPYVAERPVAAAAPRLLP
jgi:DNA-binding CsgD family transcriptional regulator